MAKSNVEIDCLEQGCRWNDSAKCGAGNILVQQGGQCLSFEPLGMPGMMPGDGMVAPAPVAGMGAGGPPPDLMALLAGRGGF